MEHSGWSRQTGAGNRGAWSGVLWASQYPEGTTFLPLREPRCQRAPGGGSARWATYRDRHGALGSRSWGRERRTPFSVARGRVAEPGVGAGAERVPGAWEAESTAAPPRPRGRQPPTPSPAPHRDSSGLGAVPPWPRPAPLLRTPARTVLRARPGQKALPGDPRDWPPHPLQGRGVHATPRSPPPLGKLTWSSPRPPIRQVFAEQASGPEPPERPAPEREALTSPFPGARVRTPRRSRPPATHSPGPC